jgi:XTP/dITP diphosphohydrolase
MKQKIVLASSNQGKIREINDILSAQSMIVLPQSDFYPEEPKEDAITFIENAIAKARYASDKTGLPAIADDSGLEVDILQGAPGVYSARYAGENKNHVANIHKLLAALEGIPFQRRRANFRCVMVYLRHAKDPAPLIAEGVWQGFITTNIQGTGGFGYDPIFYVSDYSCTAAELPSHVKNTISHRAKALQHLLSLLR